MPCIVEMRLAATRRWCALFVFVVPDAWLNCTLNARAAVTMPRALDMVCTAPSPMPYRSARAMVVISSRTVDAATSESTVISSGMVASSAIEFASRLVSRLPKYGAMP